MLYKIRYALAFPLARAAAWLVAGSDDRIVILNTTRQRNVPGKPDAGRIKPFITHGHKTAVAFNPDEPEYFLEGTPVPAIVAKLAGYEVKGLGE